MKRITATEMAELSYSTEYRDWAIEAYGASLCSVRIIMQHLVGFDDFLEEMEYELAI